MIMKTWNWMIKNVVNVIFTGTKSVVEKSDDNIYESCCDVY